MDLFLPKLSQPSHKIPRVPQHVKEKLDLVHVLEETLNLREDSDIFQMVKQFAIISVDCLLRIGKEHNNFLDIEIVVEKHL